MLNILPIPLAILGNEILYYERLDTERENEFKESILIKNCRVDFSNQKSMNEWGEEDINNLIIYIDFTHSIPFIIPNNGDKIQFECSDYIVNSIDILKHFQNKIHHIKVVAS